MSDERKQIEQDIRYDKVVWPEMFAAQCDPIVLCLERLTLAAQGIDISLERIADSKQTLSERLSSDDESA
jgi:hypothetical protein